MADVSAANAIDWSAILSWVSGITAGTFGGGWMAKMAITRHVAKVDADSSAIGEIKTDIAVIKEKLAVAGRLEGKVTETNERLIRLETAILAINNAGCDWKKHKKKIPIEE